MRKTYQSATTSYRWTYANSSNHPGANVVWCCPGHRRETDEALRAEGYKRGLEEALVRAARLMIGPAPGRYDAIAALLAHVREHGKLPEEAARA